MSTHGTAEAATTEHELVITRVIDAPREAVFKACTDAGSLMHWWGPKGYTMSECHLDLRPGGEFRYALRSPESGEMRAKFVYHKIVEPERLVFSLAFTDEEGNPVHPPQSPTWPLHILMTLTLTEEDGKTTLMLHGAPTGASRMEVQTFADGRDGMLAGFGATFDQLDQYLASV
ncbi:MAG: SRPBCC domain-containing protein [Armatimonadetes bacterium]|nr:SRPBCC domain-containing protein [Armatimonadota bacterium]